MPVFFVYILRSLADDTLYTGQTNNLRDRLGCHNRRVIKSTKGRAPYELVYFEEFPSRAAAMNREWELKKKWNTDRKRKAIAEFDTSKIAAVLGL